ncbi:MAG: MFS transporter [Actinomycetaceae bacterium]|nr:MFS transporter [Actinomycetaceae bacterium]
MADQLEDAYTIIGVTKAHRFIMLMILMGVFFDAIEQNAVGITGPVLSKDWNLTSGHIGFLNTMTFTATALGRILTGLIVDKYGRRSLLMINLLIFGGGSLLCAISPNYTLLALARFVVGYGLGGEIAVAVVMASEYFGTKQRGTAVALINVTAAGFGNMLAPAFGMLVYAIFPGQNGWRWVFALLFIPAIIVMYFRRHVPESPRYLATQGKIEEANIVLSKIASGNLRTKETSFTRYLVDTDATGIRKEKKGGWTDVLQGIYLKRTLLLITAVACSYASQISMLTLMPNILVQSGYEVQTSLWFTLVMQSGSLFGAICAAYFASKMPRKRTLTVAATIGCAAGLSMAFLATSIVLIIVCAWIFNFAVIVLNTTIWLFAPENYPTRIRGFGTSVILAAGSVSGGIFPLVSGTVFDAYGLSGMFAVLACLFVVLGITVQMCDETFGKPLIEEE